MAQTINRVSQTVYAAFHACKPFRRAITAAGGPAIITFRYAYNIARRTGIRTHRHFSTLKLMYLGVHVGGNGSIFPLSLSH